MIQYLLTRAHIICVMETHSRKIFGTQLRRANSLQEKLSWDSCKDSSASTFYLESIDCKLRVVTTVHSRNRSAMKYRQDICRQLLSSRSMLALLATFFLWRTRSVAADQWQLLWNEEFDSDGLDSTCWNHEVGFLGFNAEFQTYTDRPENVRVENGKLHVSAIRDVNAEVGYTSGRINTMNKVQIKYATVEASIKIPDMKLGLWPAFWTLGQDYELAGWPAAGELDIMELGQKQGASIGLGSQRVLTAMHWDAMGNYMVEFAFLDAPEDLSQAFHTYKMEWQPGYVAMFVDDVIVKRYDISNITLWDSPELHQFHFLLLNVAVAGHFTCCEYGFELNAFPNGTAWTMEVDYVRVYGNQFTEIILPDGVPTPAPASGTLDVSTDPPTSFWYQTESPSTPIPSLPLTIIPTRRVDSGDLVTGLPTSSATAQASSFDTSDNTDSPLMVERAGVDPSNTLANPQPIAHASSTESTAVEVSSVRDSSPSPINSSAGSSLPSGRHLKWPLTATVACYFLL
jgi:Glycosyl hydrolases family 16